MGKIRFCSVCLFECCQDHQRPQIMEIKKNTKQNSKMEIAGD